MNPTTVTTALAARSGPISSPQLSSTPEAMVFRGVADGFERVAIPSVVLGAGDLLVRVELATVCGSDRHTALGERTEPTPLVLGHEQVGHIVALGPGTAPLSVDGTLLHIGDRVVWGVAVACKKCERCQRGLTQKCLRPRKYGHTRIERGWELNGGFATHVHVIAGSDVVRVPDGIPAAVFAPASCATATVVAAFDAVSRPLENQLVVISGCGMLGLSAIALARDAGAIVVGIDPDPAHREQARAFGAAEVATPVLREVRAAIERAAASARPRSRGRTADATPTGFAVALELSGSNEAVSTLLATADVGASIALVGHVFPAPPVTVDVEHLVRNLITLTGVHNYRGKHLARAVEFLSRANHELFASLVGETVRFSDARSVMTRPPAVGARAGIRP